MGSIMQNRPVFPQQGMSEQQAQQEVQRRLQSNPNLAQRFNQLMQVNQGKSYWEIANQLAQDRGINLQNFMRPRR